jgi:hypothetical protein
MTPEERASDNSRLLAQALLILEEYYNAQDK